MGRLKLSASALLNIDVTSSAPLMRTGYFEALSTFI